MTHTGKIGRLPKHRRTELAHRVEDGELGTDIVNWLNAQPDIRKILDAKFAGRLITEQNLSDWKQSGHLEWLRHEEAREAAFALVERAEDLDDAVLDKNLSDRFATVLASEFTRLATTLLEQDADPEKRWQRLCQINRELSQLRRDDHRARSTAVLQERLYWQMDREADAEMERHDTAEKKRKIEMLMSGMERETSAAIFGGGEFGRKQAEMLYRLKSDLPTDDLRDGTWEAKRKARTKTSDPTPAEEEPTATPESDVELDSDADAKLDSDAMPETDAQPEPEATPSPAPGRGSRPRRGSARKKPAKSQESSLLKVNPAEKENRLNAYPIPAD